MLVKYGEMRRLPLHGLRKLCSGLDEKGFLPNFSATKWAQGAKKPFANMLVSALALNISERTVCCSVDTSRFSLPDIRDVDNKRHAQVDTGRNTR